MDKKKWEEECGYNEAEHYLVSAIKKHLLTEEQRKELFEYNLSIEDILNGRYTGDEEPVVLKMYKDWNEKLGWKEFLELSN